MKLKYLYLVAITSYSTLLWSCSDNHKDAIIPVKCDISQNSIEFKVKPEGVQTIAIEADGDWKITVDQGEKWLDVSPLEGKGNATLTFSTNKNIGPKRSAVITIASKGAELRTINASQERYTGSLYEYSELKGLGWTGGAGTFIDCAECEDGRALKIVTKAGTADRVKASTSTQFGAGRYEWRVYISDLDLNGRTSIAGFLYNNDTHELDFEIGSGTASARAAAGAKADEVLAYATCQANPWAQAVMPIKKNAWHIIVLDMTTKDGTENGNYVAEWSVNGVQLMKRDMNFNQKNFPFHVFSSVENLGFMGDHAPTQDNYGLFDYMEYIPYEYSIKPITDEANNDPEPEGETTIWDFNNGIIPDTWRNNGGTISDGWLVLTNGKNMSYKEKVGAGKYTWRIRVPAVGKNEKMVMGGNLYAEIGGEQSFSMFTLYGTEGQRAACTPAPNSSQMMIRCYTEAGEMFIPVDPETIHTFTIDVRINKSGKYSAMWLLDGDIVRSVNTNYDPKTIQFDLSTNSFADGGAWQGSVPTTKIYEPKYDYIEYKKYIYK